MANCVFSRRRFNNRIPTFNELFSTINSYSRMGWRNSDTTAKKSISIPLNATAGDVWYLFFTVGSSLEISRIDIIDSTHMIKTQLALRNVSGTTAQGTTLMEDGTSIESNNNVYACVHVYLKFNSTYSTNIIDYMFQNASYITTKYYYSYTAITSATAFDNLAIYKSTIDTYSSGILLSTWYSNSNGVFSIVDATNPLTLVNGIRGDTLLTYSAFREGTTGDKKIVYCAKADPNNVSSTTWPYTRTFTVKRIYENW